MADNTAIFLGLFIPLELISILLCLLLVYCFHVVQMIRKPPGSMMLGQVILIVIVHLVQGIYICCILFDHDSEDQGAQITRLLELVIFYLTATYSNYEICILLELYKRIRGSYMGKIYNRRVKIYHLICHLVAFAFTLASGLAIALDSSEDTILSYSSWVLWFVVSYPLSQLVISMIFVGLVSSRISRLHNCKTKRFIKQTLINMIALDCVKLLLIISVCVRKVVYQALEEVHRDDYICSIVLFSIGFDMIILAFRLRDPYIMEFLARKRKILIYKLKTKILSISNSIAFESNTDENMANLLQNKMFEDINIENIEYQLIALSIAMFKREDSILEECSINM